MPLLALAVNSFAGGLMSLLMLGGIFCMVVGAGLPTVGRWLGAAVGAVSGAAQRLILELKDKISIDDTLISREIAAGGAQGILTAGSLHIDSEKKKEAVEALVALGYGQAESLKAVNAIEDVEAMDSGAILKAALKKLF